MYLLDEKNTVLKLKIQKMKTMTLRWTQHTEFKIVIEDKKFTKLTISCIQIMFHI